MRRGITNEPKKTRLEGKGNKKEIMESKVSAIKIADRNDAMAWDGVIAGDCKIFEAVLSLDDAIDRIDDICKPNRIKEYKDILDEAGTEKVNVIVLEYKYPENIGDNGIYIQFDLDEYGDRAIFVHVETSVTIEDIYKFMNTGSSGGKIARACDGGNLM